MGNACSTCAAQPDAAGKEESWDHEASSHPVLPTPEEQPISSEAPVGGTDGSAELASASLGGYPGSPARSAGQRQRLTDGVDLITYRDVSAFSFRYEVVNNKLATCEFTLDASRSVNMAWKNNPANPKATVTIPPMSGREVGTLQPTSRSEAQVRLTMSWTFTATDRAALRAANSGQERSIQEAAAKMRERGVVASKFDSTESSPAWEAIAKACAGGKFVDVEFMPNDEALFVNPDDKHPAVIWKRASEVVTGPVSLFGNEISHHHVKQGALGDCWFLGALASLAEFPGLIKSLFKNAEANDAGVYEVQCFKNGKRTSVIVDDYLPCDPTSGRLCYSKSSENCIWVSLLEKAWAKVHGSYEAIESGIPYQAMMDLTGAPGRSVVVDMKEMMESDLYNKLKKWDKWRYVMVAGTPGVDRMTKSEGPRATGGIVPGHAYTLRTVKEANGTRLMELRNPWGNFEWEGDWSDNSSKWTREMKDAFKPTFGNDGDFWMCDKDFAEKFCNVSVVHFRGHFGKEWSEARREVKTSSSNYLDEFMEFEVKGKGIGFLSLVQKDKRIKGAPDYTKMAFALYGPLDESGAPTAEVVRSPNYDRGKRDLVEEVGHEEPLKQGKYQLAVFNPTRKPGVDAVMAVQFDESWEETDDRGEKKVKFRKNVHHEVQPLTPAIRAKMALATVLTSGNVSTRGPLEIRMAWLAGGDGCAFAVSNTSNRAMTVTFDFANAQGWQVAGSNTSRAEVRCEAGCKPQLVAELVQASEQAGGLRYSISAR